MKTETSATIAQENETLARARAASIRAAVQASPKLSPAERLRVAENMWAIFAEAERNGFTNAQVLVEAGQGTKEESTKRLPRFAIDPSLPPDMKNNRQDNLSKTARPYISLATSAAKILRRHEDEFVATLFAGTHFTANVADLIVNDEDEVSIELATVVRQICSGITRKYGLAKSFRLIESRSLCRYYDSLRQNVMGSWDIWKSFNDGTLVDGLQDDEHFWSLPYPHVLLGWSSLVKGLPFQLRQRIPGSGNEPTQYHDMIKADGSPWIVEGRLDIEVRLGILPVGAGGEPEAVFLTRLWTSCPMGGVRRNKEDHLAYVSNVPGATKDIGYPFQPEESVRGGGDARLEFGSEAWQAALLRFGWAGQPLRYEDAFSCGAITRIDVVSPTSCRRLFDLFRAQSPITHVSLSDVSADPHRDVEDGALLAYWIGQEKASEADELDEHIRTPISSLAYILERSIFHTKTERRLDNVLDNVCGAFKSEISEYLRVEDAHRQSIKNDITEKWQLTQTTPDDDNGAENLGTEF